jgi:tRNA(Ile)-lysidine synthase TilS/MesJ
MTPNLSYSNWESENQTYLERLTEKEVILTYSGGKDSSVILHYMLIASQKYGFKFEPHAAVYPHHVLTDAERQELDAYWQSRDTQIIWHDAAEGDEKLADALEKNMSPCLICNQMKKKIIMAHFSRIQPVWEKLVMIVSYSLWDLVSATIEHILGAIYADAALSQSLRGKDPKERFMETSQRFYPWLTLKNGLTIFKPLVKFNDQDINRVIHRNQIPLSTPTCNYKDYRPKRILANYYQKMGLHFSFEQVHQFALTNLKVPDEQFYAQFSSSDYFKKII